MIVTKRKNHVMMFILNDSNELESYTLLHLDEYESAAMIKELREVTHIVFDNNGVFKYTYENNDPVNQLYTRFAQEHQKSNSSFMNKSVAKYKVNTPGTSVLHRDPKRHIIYIARRTDQYDSLNNINIDDDRRDLFFRDCKKTGHYRKDKKYRLYLSDGEKYNYWSDFMNGKYQRVSE